MLISCGAEPQLAAHTKLRRTKIRTTKPRTRRRSRNWALALAVAVSVLAVVLVARQNQNERTIAAVGVSKKMNNFYRSKKLEVTGVEFVTRWEGITFT